MLVLAVAGAAAAWVLPSPRPAALRRCCHQARMCTEIGVAPDAGDDDEIDESIYDQLSSDDYECSEGRIITELKSTDKENPLTDRFMMVMRALQGEFSEVEGEADNELVEDALTTALLNFPATVALSVVTRPLESDAQAEELVAQLNLMLSTLEGAEAPSVVVKQRPGGRRSLTFSLKVPDAGALSMLREALRDDERVQMVF